MTISDLQPYDPFMDKAAKSQARLTKIMEKFQNFTANSDILSSDTTILYLVLKSNIILNDNQIRVLLGLGDENKVHDVIYCGILRDAKYAASKLFTLLNFSSLLEMPLTDLKQLCYEIALKYKAIFFVPVEAKIKIRPPQREFPSFQDTTQLSLLRSNSGFIPSSYLASNFRNLYNRTTDAMSGTTYSSEFMSASYNSIRPYPQGYSEIEDAEYVEIIKFISKFNQMWIVAALLNREYQELKAN